MKRDTQIGLRISAGELEQIDQHAKQRGMSRSAYLIWAALEAPPGPGTLQERVEALERKLQSLENSWASETP